MELDVELSLLCFVEEVEFSDDQRGWSFLELSTEEESLSFIGTVILASTSKLLNIMRSGGFSTSW